MKTRFPVDPDLLDLFEAVLTGQRTGAAVFDRTLWDRLESLQLTRLSVPESAGGAGATWWESAALLTIAARAGVHLPVAEHDVMAGALLADAGLQLDERILTVAVMDVNGVASRVPWAREAERIVALRPAGEDLLLADLAADQCTIEPGGNLAGEARDRVDLDLPRVSWSKVDPILEHRMMVRGALARSVQACGAMKAVIGLCVEHARTRHQFGRPLAAFQAIEQLIADASAEAALASAAVDAAISGAASDVWDDSMTRAVAIAKSCVGRATTVVVRNAHQVHGAIGTTIEHSLQDYTLSIQSWRSEYGTAARWERTLADDLASTADWWHQLTAAPERS